MLFRTKNKHKINFMLNYYEFLVRNRNIEEYLFIEFNSITCIQFGRKRKKRLYCLMQT